MTNRRPQVAELTLIVAMTTSAVVAGCGGPKPARDVAPATLGTALCDPSGPGPTPEPDTNAKLPPFEGPMVYPQPSSVVDQLRRVGLDPKNLPPFDKLERRQLGVVMKTFATSLGLKCIGCHDIDDYKKPSPRKRVAKRMWDDFVRVLAFENGDAVYCDSCHQGSVRVIDRRDKGVVAGYMDDVFVGKMKRSDGKDHDCGTCHGDPPDFKFLSDWRQGK